MTERPRPPYGDSQPGDRLAGIKETLAMFDRLGPQEQDMAWLVAEVERLRILLHAIYGNTKITIDRNQPRDMANFLRELEMMTEEWK
jgi:hypothetical protein